jgi:hypothetical protein
MQGTDMTRAELDLGWFMGMVRSLVILQNKGLVKA